MYPNSHSARHPAQTLSLNSQYYAPSYDFPGYYQDPSTSGWSSVCAPREEYLYGFPGSSPSPGQVIFSSPELSVTPNAAGEAYNFVPGQDAFNCGRRPHESARPSFSGTKTRTKDKYRVVYTDQQRLELEKEFQCNQYITMRRKTELSMALSLSERQNRRAKERKINRKKLQHPEKASTTTPTPLTAAGPSDPHTPPSLSV
uniref:homeobox protein CDX-1a isoform X2 n=1 Tax=Gasterosteus aculeatus aculeatus TaxID=481459 RepID=UPI001A98F25F|nr:homeobox protein CDX-1a isoform X2 [Gasterosteus aculeatus aculeatus]